MEAMNLPQTGSKRPEQRGGKRKGQEGQYVMWKALGSGAEKGKGEA